MASAGRSWAAACPPIAFRDLAIQRRENDLVGASFGRGFYVFDDYSVLREATEAALGQEASLFPVRPARWYVEREPLGDDGRASQGAAYFVAPNPPFGAVFTYHLAEELRSRAKQRQEAEKPLVEAGKDTPFPGWAELEAERREEKPAVVLTVKDEAGNVVRRVEGETGKGFHRVAWDLRFPATQAIGPRSPSQAEGGQQPRGVLAAPGRYTVSLAKQVDGKTTVLAGPVPFEVVRLRPGALPGADPKETAAFLARVAEVSRTTSAASEAVSQAQKRVEALGTALDRSRSAPESLDAELHAIRQELHAIDEALGGNRARGSIEDDGVATITRRVQVAQMGTSWSTYGPTPTHRRSLEIAESDFAGVRERLNALLNQRIPALEQKLEQAGAPWTPGRSVP